MTAIRYRFRPLTWVGASTPPDRRRGRATFRANYQDPLARLTYELVSLGASEAIIEADFRESDIRQDGLPRANAKAGAHPGVRLAFEGAHGPLIYQTDVHESWQHNLRAIALGLEALRAVDRYGISGHGEQYTGWRAISAPAAQLTPREAALQRLADLASWPSKLDHADAAGLEPAYRAAARRCHPDTGGTKELFQELGRVMAILQAAAR